MYWILFVGIALVSYLVQSNLKRTFEEYSKAVSYTHLTLPTNSRV